MNGCLTNMVSALDPKKSVIKRLWCTYIIKRKEIVPHVTICLPLREAPSLEENQILRSNFPCPREVTL